MHLTFPTCTNTLVQKSFGGKKKKKGQVWREKGSAEGHRGLPASAYQHRKDESIKEGEVGPQS